MSSLASFRCCVLLLLLLAGASFSCSVEGRQDTNFHGKVQKVIDGDSLVISNSGEKIEVRLYGIDAPEYRQPFSNTSRNFVRKKLLGKNVLVEPVTVDKYKRKVSIVYHNGTSINHELIKEGLAWVYPRYCKQKICEEWKKSEKGAQAERKKLWSEKNPVPPWKWRRQNRKNN